MSGRVLSVRPALLIVLVLAALLAGCGDRGGSAGAAGHTGATAPAGGSPSPVAATSAPPDADRAMTHLRVLAAEIGIRAATTPAEQRAADYIADQLRASGYEVALEPFPVRTRTDDSQLIVNGSSTPTAAYTMGGAPLAVVSGPLVYVARGTDADLASAGAHGAIALADRGGTPFAVKARAAQAAGALALVVVNDRPGAFRGTVEDGGSSIAIPVIGISGEERDVLLARSRAGVQATVTASIRVIDGTSRDVVGRTPGRACAAYLGAHYDSVPQGPGANDNASGTATVLELARTRRTPGVCIVLFGAEELGLFGSKAFVAAHDQHETRFMLNFDMTGKITRPIFVGDDRLAALGVAVAQAQGLTMPAEAFPPGASSDHASFADAGVPAITVHSGDDPLMHTPADAVANVARDDVQRLLLVGAGLLDRLLADRAWWTP